MRLSSLAIALICALPAKADVPFLALDFDAASATARTEHTLLLVDLTSASSDTCAQMDKSTWPDPAVDRWIAAHAVAIRLDADESRELVARFGLAEFPTLLLLRDGKELDRHSGCTTADDFVAWGDAALAGRTEDAVVLGRARALLTSDDFDARASAAFDAASRGDDDVARQHLLWLWQHADHDVNHAELRVSRLPDEMARVAKRDETARADFGRILDKADAELQAWPGVPEQARWREWVALCEAFEQCGRIVAWYDAHRDENGQVFAAEPKSDDLSARRRQLYEVLMSGGRPVDAVRLLPDLRPLLKQRMDAFHESISTDIALFDDAEKLRWRAARNKELRDDMALVYAGLLGAGRRDEAGVWAATLLGLLDDADSRVALVGAALDHSSARPSKLGVWLDQAAAMGAEVTQLRARLASTAGTAK